MTGMSPLPAGYRVVDVPESRQPEFLAVDHLAFAFEPTPETSALVPFTLTMDRAVAVEGPDGELAAVHASFPFTLPVPGAQVPCSGLTWVGARASARSLSLIHI